MNNLDRAALLVSMISIISDLIQGIPVETDLEELERALSMLDLSIDLTSISLVELLQMLCLQLAIVDLDLGENRRTPS